ncbi:MAG: MFS transporter [Dermatophilaceae bacterium]|nr:MFS transporter [Intrasporangiaceae bacterium]
MKQAFQKSLEVWRIRDVRLMLGASALMTAALGLSMVTLLLRVHASGAGPFAATALLLCISLPTILTMGIAGSLADRYDSRHILVSSLLVQAAALIGLSLRTDLPATFALTALATLAGSLAMPVWTAILPHLAGEEHMARLVSVQQGLRAIAMPAGAGVAGVVVQTWGDGVAMLIAAGLTLVAGLTPLMVRTRRVPVTPEPISLLPFTALRTLRGHRVAFVLVLALVPFIMAVEAVNAVEVFLVRDILGATPAQFGLAAVAGGIGAVIGAFAAGLVEDPRRRIPLTLAALASTAATQIGQGVVPDFMLYLVLCLVIGVALGLANALIFVVILDQTPEASRGRVIALVSGLARSGSVVATVLGGALAVALGPRLAFVTTGSFGLVTAGLAAYAVHRSLTGETRSVRHAAGDVHAGR